MQYRHGVYLVHLTRSCVAVQRAAGMAVICSVITRMCKNLANLYQALLFTVDAHRNLRGVADVQRREGV